MLTKKVMREICTFASSYSIFSLPLIEFKLKGIFVFFIWKFFYAPNLSINVIRHCHELVYGMCHLNNSGRRDPSSFLMVVHVHALLKGTAMNLTINIACIRDDSPCPIILLFYETMLFSRILLPPVFMLLWCLSIQHLSFLASTALCKFIPR